MVDGKKSSYAMSLHPGTLIQPVYIKTLQDKLKLNMRTMKSLGVVFNEIDPVLFVLFGCYFLLHVVGSLIVCYLDD
jgi:hypothetical protein